jgi:hypothetical protein
LMERAFSPCYLVLHADRGLRLQAGLGGAFSACPPDPTAA